MTLWIVFVLCFILCSIHAPAEMLVLRPEDPLLSFSPRWQTTESLNGDSYVFTTRIGQVLKAKIPVNATYLEYRGYRRTSGSVYGVCLDCNITRLFSFADGYDPNIPDNASAELATLFVMYLEPTRTHDFTLFNFPDTQFNQESELTFHSLVVNMEPLARTPTNSFGASQGSSFPVSPMTPSVTDNLSVTSTFTPNVTATITTAQSSGPVEPIGNTSRPTGSTGINRTLITVIATLCSIAGLTGLVVLVLFLRKNRAGTFRPGALSIMFRREKVSSEFFNDKPAFSPQPSPRLITPPSNPSPVGQAFIAQPPKGRRRGDTFRPLIIPRFGEDLNFNDHTKYNLSRPYKRI